MQATSLKSNAARLAEPNQFALLRQRRFAPFFWTLFSGAANDNLFKFSFTVLVTYQLSVSWMPPQMAGLVIGALFILPYVLFSATSGQLADKLEKTGIMRRWAASSWRWPGAWRRSAFPWRRPAIRRCASTGTRSPKPGAT